MIGKVVMEISNSEMRAAVQYYLNSDLFFSKHKVKVTEIYSRSNGRFTIRFDGDTDPEFAEPEKVKAAASTTAASGGGG